MSWTLNVPATSKATFNDAVDAAEVLGDQFDLIGVREDVLTAKGLIKALAIRVKREWVSASASGHSLQPTQGDNYYDGIQISVVGSRPPEPVKPDGD